MDVLIIESDGAFAERLGNALRAHGVEPRIFTDGEAALELARQHPPRAVVLALELGDKPSAGFSWCNRFKRDEGLRNVPLVLTSALATAETFAHHQRLKTRADAYLHKPFEPDRLLESLRAWLPIGAAPAGSDEALAAELLGEEDIEAIEPEEIDPADGFDDLFVDLAQPPAVEPPPTAEKTVVDRHRDEASDGAAIRAEFDPDATRVELDVPVPARSPGPSAADIRSLETAIAELESRIADQGAEIAGVRGEAAALQQRLEEAERELIEARGEAAALQERLAATEAELARAREALETARGEADDRAAQVVKVREEWERTAAELEQSLAILEQTRAELEQASGEVEAARAARDQALAAAQAARAEVEALQGRLAEAEASAAADRERRARAMEAIAAAHGILAGNEGG